MSSRKNEHFDMNGFPYSETPADFDKGHLNVLIHDHPRQSTSMMYCDQSRIVQYLHPTSKLQKLGV